MSGNSELIMPKYSIKAIILDIDGVIVGEKTGYNFPNPHPEVIRAMRQLQNSGVPIILCTAKPNFAIQNIIEMAHLDNLHITDGGGVVIDPLNHKTLQARFIPTASVLKIVTTLLQNNIYTELYTTSEYVIQESQASQKTTKHQTVIQVPPRQVKDLLDEITWLDVTKIMPIATNPEEQKIVVTLLAPFESVATISWGVHPSILPLQFGIITAPGISKAVAATEIANALKIDIKSILGVGDSKSDWQFISDCGYGAAMGNAQPELKTLVLTKQANGFIAPSVDENGLLAVFKHFEL